MSEPRATGRCLCGAVRYEVRGALRDVVNCHCDECKRWNGSVGAYAATRATGLVVSSSALRWIESPHSDRGARRGFCVECGSSLFWDAPDGDSISIAAGTLDRPTGLRTVGHWYTHQAGDYYEQLLRRSAIDVAVGAHRFAKRTLEAGLTTIRDVGSAEFIDIALRNAIARGEVAGPRIFAAGLAIGCHTGGVPGVGDWSGAWRPNRLCH